MGVVALVMAGGKGERLGLAEEKPLIKIHGKPMVRYVIEALKKSRCVDRIIVVTSKNTKKTFDEVKRFGVEAVEAPGKGYVLDVKHVVKRFGLNCVVLVVSADLPCLTPRIVDEVVKCFMVAGKPALCVVVSAKAYRGMGLKPSLTFMFNGEEVVPVGINIISGDRIDEPKIEEKVFVLAEDKVKFVVNVNTVEELKVAEKVLADDWAV